MSDIFTTASVRSVSIGKEAWATPKFPGVINNIPVKLEVNTFEKKSFSKEVRQFKSEYNKEFLTCAKSAWQGNKSRYKGALDAGTEIKKVLREPEGEELLPLLFEGNDDSYEMIESLLLAKDSLNSKIVEARALTVLRRVPATSDFDPAEISIDDVEKIHPKLKSQLAIYYQTEDAAVTEDYIDLDSKEFFYTAEKADAAQSNYDDEAEAKKS